MRQLPPSNSTSPQGSRPGTQYKNNQSPKQLNNNFLKQSPCHSNNGSVESITLSKGNNQYQQQELIILDDAPKKENSFSSHSNSSREEKQMQLKKNIDSPRNSSIHSNSSQKEKQIKLGQNQTGYANQYSKHLRQDSNTPFIKTDTKNLFNTNNTQQTDTNLEIPTSTRDLLTKSQTRQIFKSTKNQVVSTKQHSNENPPTRDPSPLRTYEKTIDQRPKTSLKKTCLSYFGCGKSTKEYIIKQINSAREFFQEWVNNIPAHYKVTETKSGTLVYLTAFPSQLRNRK